MKQPHKIEIFSAGCPACQETIELVKNIAGASNELHILDMHERDVAERAKDHGIRSLPAVVIDGKLAACCASRGPDEEILREALR
jgi:glutaredoxin 3